MLLKSVVEIIVENITVETIIIIQITDRSTIDASGSRPAAGGSFRHQRHTAESGTGAIGTSCASGNGSQRRRSSPRARVL